MATREPLCLRQPLPTRGGVYLTRGTICSIIVSTKPQLRTGTARVSLRKVVESMNPRRGKWLFAAVFASAFFLGTASVALASEANSATSIFYGPVRIAGTYLCGGQQATIDNYWDGAYGNTTGWSNDVCSTPDNRPAGQLGSISYLWKGTSGQGGVLYGQSGWTYNSGTSQYVDSWWDCPSGTCPSAAYYSAVKGRFWNSDAGVYEQAGYFTDSPNLNFG